MKKVFNIFILCFLFGSVAFAQTSENTVAYYYAGNKVPQYVVSNPNPFYQTNLPYLNEAISLSITDGDPSHLSNALQQIKDGTYIGMSVSLEMEHGLYRIVGAQRTSRGFEVNSDFVATRMSKVSDQVKDEVRSALDNIGKERAKTPQNLYEHLNKIEEAQDLHLEMQRRADFTYSSDYQIAANYLGRELSRVYFNGQGILKNVPFASDDDAILISNPLTKEGRAVRKKYNELLIGHSIVASRCESIDGDTKEKISGGCSSFQSFSDHLKMALVLSDRFSVNGNQESFSLLQDSIDPALGFVRGFANGFIGGGQDTIESFKLLLSSDFLDLSERLAQGLYHGLINYKKTAKVINNWVADKLDVLILGTKEEAGELVGRLAFEIFSVVVPGAAARAMKYGPSFIEALAIRRLPDSKVLGPLIDREISLMELTKATKLLREAKVDTETRVGFLKAFGPKSKVTKMHEHTVFYRYYFPGYNSPRSHWLTDRLVNNPIEALDIKVPLGVPAGTQPTLVEWMVPKGTPVISGPIRNGTKSQIFVPDLEVLLKP